MANSPIANSSAIATLKALMQTANINSYRALAQRANVSRWQIQQLRAGNAEKMRIETLRQIAAALEIEWVELVRAFTTSQASATGEARNKETGENLSQLNKSSGHQVQQESAKTHATDLHPESLSLGPPSVDTLSADTIQLEALQTLETWLTQWPTISKRAHEKGEALSAAKILPFIRPVEQLMREWHVEPIAAVDEQIPYDPQYHQLTKGSAKVGDIVQVSHVGYLHQGRLLHRAKVKPIC